MIDVRIIARIAELFYVHNISQYEIADKFNFSKAKVCRLIKEAKKREIIEFQIKNVDKRPIELEQKFERKFKLKEVIIFYDSDINSYDEKVVFQKIGKIGSDYINRIIDNDLNFALTWGKTLYYTIKNLKLDKKKHNINIFSSIGSVSLTKTDYQNVNLAHMLAEGVKGTSYPIYLPLILKTADLKKSLMQENPIEKVLGDTSKIDYFFTSLGTISKNSRMYILGGFDLNFFNALISKKIVGEIGLNFYDIDGNFIKAGLEDRTINLSVDEIRKIKNKIVIAFGDEKVDAISGFLKTQIADVMITDSKTAEKVLDSA